MQNYKELKVWEKAHHFTLKVYEYSKTFPKEETFSLIPQLRRAAVAIPANIAEGCGKSPSPDLAKYLNIALGLANETEYYLILSKDLYYLQQEIYDVLQKLINEIKAMLISLIQKVKA